MSTDANVCGERLVNQWLALSRALGMHAEGNEAVLRIAASLVELLNQELARGEGHLVLHVDSGCVFVHGTMLRFNRQGYVRARAFIDLLVQVQMNEIEVTRAVTAEEVTAFTKAWRGAATKLGGDGEWPVTTGPVRAQMVPSHIAQDEARRQHRGRILEEWCALQYVLQRWHAAPEEGKVGPSVVARRVLQRLVDHEDREPGYLMGLALFAPDGAGLGPRSALFAATLAVRLGLGRTVARGCGLAAIYMAIGAPAATPAEELDSWNAHFGLPASHEWVLRAGVERITNAKIDGLEPPLEAMIAAFATTCVRWMKTSTPREVLATPEDCWPGSTDEPLFKAFAARIRKLLADGLPGALGTANGLPALRRAANEVVLRRPDGSLACVGTDGFVELDTAGPAPQAWYGFDAWPVEDDEPTFTAE